MTKTQIKISSRIAISFTPEMREAVASLARSRQIPFSQAAKILLIMGIVEATRFPCEGCSKPMLEGELVFFSEDSVWHKACYDKEHKPHENQ